MLPACRHSGGHSPPHLEEGEGRGERGEGREVEREEGEGREVEREEGEVGGGVRGKYCQ